MGGVSQYEASGMGQRGIKNVAAAATETGKFMAVKFSADGTLTTIAESGDNLTDWPVSKGDTVVGAFTSVTPSVAAIAYYSDPGQV